MKKNEQILLTDFVQYPIRWVGRVKAKVCFQGRERKRKK